MARFGRVLDRAQTGMVRRQQPAVPYHQREHQARGTRARRSAVPLCGLCQDPDSSPRLTWRGWLWHLGGVRTVNEDAVFENAPSLAVRTTSSSNTSASEGNFRGRVVSSLIKLGTRAILSRPSLSYRDSCPRFRLGSGMLQAIAGRSAPCRFACVVRLDQSPRVATYQRGEDSTDKFMAKPQYDPGVVASTSLVYQ